MVKKKEEKSISSFGIKIIKYSFKNCILKSQAKM